MEKKHIEVSESTHRLVMMTKHKWGMRTAEEVIKKGIELIEAHLS